MVKRRQLIPWRAAGTRAEMRRNADEVVRDTGWVFNNQTGDTLTLDEFVRTGDAEVDIYLDRLGWSGISPQITMLEIGSGIGRMTSAFTRRLIPQLLQMSMQHFLNVAVKPFLASGDLAL